MDPLTFAGLACVLAGLFFLERHWAERRLAAWARRGSAQILSSERCYWRRGPFDVLGDYAVFRVRIRDAGRRERIGWVRLGDFYLGLASDEALVRWDDRPVR